MKSPSARAEASGITDLVGRAERIDPKSCLSMLVLTPSSMLPTS